MADEIARVTVDALVRASIAAGVELEVLAGRAGLERRVGNPVSRRRPGWRSPASTRRSRPGACWSSAQSEVRYPRRALDAGDAARDDRQASSARQPCVVVTKRLDAARWPGRGGRQRAACRCCAPRCSTPVAFAKLRRAARRAAGAAQVAPRRARRRARPRRADGRRERHRQERVRARARSAAATAWWPTTSWRSRRRGGAIVIGTCPPLTRHHMELRGIGIINIQDLFGVAVDADLEARRAGRASWSAGTPTREYERLGPRRDLRATSSACRSPRLHAGRARPQHRHPGRGGGAQPPAAGARRTRGAAAGGASRSRAGAEPAVGRGSGGSA